MIGWGAVARCGAHQHDDTSHIDRGSSLVIHCEGLGRVSGRGSEGFGMTL